MANAKIDEIEGIGLAYAEKLRSAGIASTDKLLETCCQKNGRERIARETGIDEKKILKWVNMADLLRIKGVGAEYAELLENAGVDTVKELASRNPESLASKMEEVNARNKLTRRVPNRNETKKWVDEAKSLPPIISY